jgi:hypothetical protein
MSNVKQSIKEKQARKMAEHRALRNEEEKTEAKAQHRKEQAKFRASQTEEEKARDRIQNKQQKRTRLVLETEQEKRERTQKTALHRGTRIDGKQEDISSDFFNNIVSFSDDRVCEFLSRTVKRFNDSVESVRAFLKEFKGCPLRPFFHNFEDCPLKACLLFLYNSGHAYFPKELTHPMHSDVCPSMRPDLENASEMDEPVRKALEALQAYGDSFTAESFVTKRLLDFRQRVPLEGKLCACGCCGVRDQEQVLDRQKRKT